MHAAIVTASERSPTGNPDRLGVFASALCAIHCLVTPPLLVAAPAFGRVWSHPASHWIMALVVIPLAIFTVVRGFRIHRRKWVVAAASFGAVLILTGAALPALGAETAGGCEACCPSGAGDTTGTTDLVVPAAAIVTTLGGAALVVAHLGNLCACRRRCCSPS